MEKKTALTFDDYAGSGGVDLLADASTSSSVLEVKSRGEEANSEGTLDEVRQMLVTRIGAFDEYYRTSPGSGMIITEDGSDDELAFVEKVGDVTLRPEE